MAPAPRPRPNGDLRQTSRAGLVRRPTSDDVDQQHHAEWWGRGQGRTRAEPPICTAAWSMGWAFDAVLERTIGAVGLA